VPPKACKHKTEGAFSSFPTLSLLPILSKLLLVLYNLFIIIQSRWRQESLSLAVDVRPSRSTPLNCLLTIFPVSGLSAAHTIYLAGGNVVVLDKQGKLVLQIGDQVANKSTQVSSVVTRPRQPLESTVPSPEHKSSTESRTASSNSTMIP
jgi:hypothetical protein